MRLRPIVALALLLAAAASLAAPSAGVATTTPPSCYDYITNTSHPATDWLVTPGTLIGTSGPDVLVGTFGSDVIKGLGGNDIICGSPDYVTDIGDPDVADGGAGDDRVIARGKAIGGSGDDFVLTDWVGSKADGGSGSDEVWANQGAVGDGGSGNDILRSYFGGAAALLGGSGGDTVYNQTGADKIDCGAAYDLVYANGATDVRRCEGVAPPPN
jgi:Ca2+-binding RTX toxin-like protein